MSTSDLVELDREIFQLRREEQEVCWKLYQDPELFDKIFYKDLEGKKGYKRLLEDLSHVRLVPEASIDEVIEEMLRRTGRFGIRTYTYHNTVYLVCNPGDTFLYLYLLYLDLLAEKSKKSEKSFCCKFQERKREERKKDQERRREIVQGWMSEEEMEVKFTKRLRFWLLKKETQHDRYSNCIFTYAQEWAVAMQRALREGKEISEVADEASNFVDYYGISGSIHHFAAWVIAEFWKHGDEFREWYKNPVIETRMGDD